MSTLYVNFAIVVNHIEWFIFDIISDAGMSRQATAISTATTEAPSDDE